MNIIDCKSIAQKWKDEIKASNTKACLCVIQVGDNSASNAYVRGKIKDAKEVGIECIHKHIEAENRDQVLDDLYGVLDEVNEDNNIDGVIVQLPLPFDLEFKDISCYISYEKDVDGFMRDSDFKPCTPEGIIEMLTEIGVNPDGKLCVIAGRSDIVGKPLAKMMLDKNATVVTCHSHTSREQLEHFAKEADIFVSAVGRANFIDSSVFKDGAIVVDVGINRTDNGLCGDITISPSSNNISITPVPGGVGLLTRAMLMRHVVEARSIKEWLND